jgi:hypothetical protein
MNRLLHKAHWFKRGPKPEDLIPRNSWNIVKGDKVQILRGKDAGKQGVVREVVRDRNAVIVDKLRMKKR